MIGLYVHPFLKEVKQVVKWSDFLRTCSQDGRSSVQGVSKGCLTGAPEDPNVAPAVPNVAHGAAKEAARVSQGA